MSDSDIPILIIPSVTAGADQHPDTSGPLPKPLAATLLRTLYSGTVVVFQNVEMPLFKVERKQLEEVQVPVTTSCKTSSDRRRAEREFLFGLGDYLKPEPRQWVIVADAASLALRNIDHLLPPDLPGPYAPPEIDLLWTKTGGAPGSSQPSASPGLWAVRGEHLPQVLARWREAWATAPPDAAPAAVWSAVVRDLPLRKRPFEKGEVVSPPLNAVDWRALTSAAFVTVPDWPEEERWKFLQALYFGTFFGDETGMMVNVLES